MLGGNLPGNDAFTLKLITNDEVIAVNQNSEKPIIVSWKDLGISGKQIVRDLWEQNYIGSFENEFSEIINPHGGKLYRIKN